MNVLIKPYHTVVGTMKMRAWPTIKYHPKSANNVAVLVGPKVPSDPSKTVLSSYYRFSKTGFSAACLTDVVSQV